MYSSMEAYWAQKKTQYRKEKGRLETYFSLLAPFFDDLAHTLIPSIIFSNT